MTSILNSMNIRTKDNRIAIIGAGPAGIATAIQLKRYHIDPIVFEQGEIGGILKNANLVENYPGFPSGITGTALVKLFSKQFNNSDIEHYNEKVFSVKYEHKTFFLTSNERTVQADILVLATGTKPKTIANLQITDDISSRVTYEVYPLINEKNKSIAIIGGGDAAFDYALNLSKQNDVIIMHRGNEAQCIPLLLERSQLAERIIYRQNIEVSEINIVGNRLNLSLRSGNKEITEFLEVNYLVIAVGRKPNMDYLDDELRNNLGSVIRKNVLYLIGDITNDIYRQTAICVGDGVRTAMKIYRYINGV